VRTYNEIVFNEVDVRLNSDKVGSSIPNAQFEMQIGTGGVGCVIDSTESFDWKSVTTDELFGGKRILLFSLPGAFTPTCSNSQLPGFEDIYDNFINDCGIDDIYCMAVNDAFVMNAWGKSLGIEKVKLIPDGNGEFTGMFGASVEKDNLGFGSRSWRYAMVVNDKVVEKIWVEPGIGSNIKDDPYVETNPLDIYKELSK
jgi:peroxiredoxin